ncbi:DUF4296 domain-containing protein [Fodinibius halophilus]|uniref:DUF4296 domain-containing protein n=1 Tax=Fodinibius halophilus TaxID=1736908 RepID=A0A6M1THR3_9BACT|nr:DUF4296 domain-containing protein [Fodinibius halophilus]NGP88190.1 DUF4296 domain-containing protein [Fodinibius halophilus]
MFKNIFLLLLLLSFVGCNDEEKPENLIPEEKYTPMLVEMQLLKSYSENSKVDTTTVDSLTSEVFKKYEVTQNQFHKSHTYYQQFPAEQKKRVEQAIEKLKMELVTKNDSTSTPSPDEKPAPTKQ